MMAATEEELVDIAVLELPVSVVVADDDDDAAELVIAVDEDEDEEIVAE